MTVTPDPRIVVVTTEFLRGDHSVLDFTYAFRGAVNDVVQARPLAGVEVDLFYALEEWETAGWDGRPDVVDRLRVLARSVVTGR